MGVLIKTIFGKEENITREDIDKYIIKPSLRESTLIEYKSADKFRIDKQGRLLDEKGIVDKREEIIIKPLVSFLNKFSNEGGVLVLGIRDENHIPKEITGADLKVFTFERLRSWIHNFISSIPLVRDFPEIEIKSADIEDEKAVIFIEAHPKDLNTVYFSKLSNLVYVRKNDESISCSLEEVCKMIKEKIIAKIFVDVEIIKKEEINEKWIKYRLHFNYINEGNKPGEWVRSILGFRMLQGDPKDIQVFSVSAPVHWNPGGWLEDCFLIFEEDFFLRDIIYPKGVLSYRIGELEIQIAKTAKALMIIETFEHEGFTKQVFIISPEGLKESQRVFRSYITL